MKIRLSFILFIYFIISVSNTVSAVNYDTCYCIDSKYVTRLCYEYWPDDGASIYNTKTVVRGYDQYDSLVIRVASSDSLPVVDNGYTKMTHVIGARFVYDERHRLMQEIWYQEVWHHHLLIEYTYQKRNPDRIRYAKMYKRIIYDTLGFYADKKQYECIAKKRYIYKYYTSDEYAYQGFVILKNFDINKERRFNRKKFYRYELRYPHGSMGCVVDD